MFTDESLAVVECPSVWRVDVKTKDKETETPAITRYQRGLQTTRRKEAECQTDSFMYVQEEISVDSSELDVEVLQSLRRLEPLMSRELERSSRSTAFEDPSRWSRGGGGALDPAAGGAVRLSVAACCGAGAPELESLPVTAVSWSATGAYVACGLGRTDHQDWCLHRAAVCVWNAASVRTANVAANVAAGQDQQKAHTILETPSCVQSVQYHPSNASLLAAGTFTGELLVWNVASAAEGEPLLASSLGAAAAGQELAHREPVVEVLWVRKPASAASSRDHLLTAGSDGLLLLWQLESRKASLALGNAYRLSAKSLPKSLRVRTSGRGASVGVTCARFVGGVSGGASSLTLAVGCESGAVLICRVKPRPASKQPLDPAAPATALPDPTLRAIDSGGIGAVFGLDVLPQPLPQQLLLVCGLSGACALYPVGNLDAKADAAAAASGSNPASAAATQQLVCLETTAGAAHSCSAAWKPGGLVAVATEQFGCLLYSLAAEAASAPLTALGTGLAGSMQQQQQHTVKCVQWNPANHSWLAAGCSDGRLVVWQVADSVSKTVDTASVAAFLTGLTSSGVTTSKSGGGGGDDEGQKTG